MKEKVCGVFLLVGILLASCQEDTPIDNVMLPTDLQVTVEQTTEPYQVSVIASAQKVNFFRFYFGEDDQYIEQKEGELIYTYGAAGEYELMVQAHATSADFIQYTETVIIEEPDPADLLPDEGYMTPTSYDGMTLVWGDEFDGDDLNDADWTYEIGTGSGGWGNNELQYYTDENTTMIDGNLVIWARKESVGGSAYTSSRIVTAGSREFQYGRVDIRAALPEDQGIWPALWMLGANFKEIGWPQCGEIDIMEMIGGAGRENTVHGTIHYSTDGGYATSGKSYQLDQGVFADAFHVFSIVWTEQSIQWLVDDIPYNEIDISAADKSEFRAPFFFIFNVAVGGNWPGSPDASTRFPQLMAVDYIRVFQLN
ncbi:MAG: glycoside hydrolase family 16 protein [Cyclobacteriaceae bacterium]|nr:glycoside hydrolase family 16 protein [Cyclobacteriaceae bacterium SS2]